MHWKIIEEIIHHDDSLLPVKTVEMISKRLRDDLSKHTKPLTALKIAYLLTLLKLKCAAKNEKEILKSFSHFAEILLHEIETTENQYYVRSIADHYLSHLSLLAKDESKILRKISKLQMKNHSALLALNPPKLERERKFIVGTLKKHFVFAGFLLSLALYFMLSSLFNMASFAEEYLVFSEYTSATINGFINNFFLILFAGSVIFGFFYFFKKEEK